ncbi:MAG TPA: hypothetical protein VJ922_07100 [Actinomycetota bacterium]|nr:hypothetical protein [Actinomycetota bacterium]
MPEPPEIRITGGSPSDDEEAAIREAILRLWRQEQSEARRGGGGSAWVVAARAEGSGWGAADVRGLTDAWRLGTRMPGFGLLSVRRTGRGDSK